MKKLESSLLNMTVVLTVISVIAGGLLAYVNGVTEGPIREIKEKALADGIKSVLQANEATVQQIDTIDGGLAIVYKTDKGTAVQAINNSAFGGSIKVLVGFDAEGTILGYSVLEHAETPGLGAKAGEWFQKGAKGDIIGKQPAKNNLTVSKDGGEVDAITASTITSRAFLGAVNDAYKAYVGEAVDANSGATQQVNGNN
ncbi:MAG: RnfABCDGE type electron transport complex subunit G [Bacteroidaceae bacterium]|nr:RnfABCDGE type electron transport complex subunit G [Bacteroidaceae bacterium]